MSGDVYERLFVASLPLIERLSRFFCRQSRMTAEDVEDFVAHVRLHLLEKEFAALRSFEGRCSLATFLSLVIQHQLVDYRARHWGRFRPSTAARRHGPTSIRLEMLLRRDGMSIADAVAAMQGAGLAITREEAEGMAGDFPGRKTRPVEVDLDEAKALELAVGIETIELQAEAGERCATSRALEEAMSTAMSQLPADDRTIVRLHFGAGMTVAEISRSLGLEQRPTYRRILRICGALREHLIAAGLDGARVEALLGRADCNLDFGLREVENPDAASSTDVEGNLSR